MQQQLNVQLTIQIPEDKVLISKIELEELQRNKLTGKSWSMKDLEAQTGRKSDWLQEKILYLPRFKQKLDARNGGFVYYPKGKGSPWAFQATKMAKFLDDNFHLIWGG
ncbi:DUF771 domain-containing protein [Lysinibacillus fusiformis]|uniref:DUF771 domain-containing protein n=1 Tax=Lysinibacillus fusiformis TaxID=28031 RepID=UPI001EF48838|nr:DUF771 domain-containing protein [Lysinibacillus fusiformis]MCG7435534.1 DUF771 domain-containing protein [Lysinibacillus fusiformis]